jgi:ribosomal protein S27AE
MNKEKKCFKCGEIKPLSEYYKHSKMADGHVNKCKECAKKDAMKNRKDNIEYYQEYDRNRSNLPHRVDARYQYSKTENYRISHNSATSRWNKNNQKKKYAITMIGNAIRDKKLDKPSKCSNCNSEGRIHGHHDDYDKPIEVRWLCSKCHRSWHKEHGEAKNAA